MRGFHPVVRRRLAAALFALLPLGAWAADPQITSMSDTPDPATAGGLYTNCALRRHAKSALAMNDRERNEFIDWARGQLPLKSLDE